jgi:hypothetical protein
LGLQLGDRKRPERASSVVDDKPPIEVVRGHDLVSIYVTSARWWDVALSRQDLSPSRQTARTPQSPIPAGAAAYPRDNPKAVVKMLDAGHFALETNVDDIAVAIDQLLDGG